jgi:hypothetical protein
VGVSKEYSLWGASLLSDYAAGRKMWGSLYLKKKLVDTPQEDTKKMEQFYGEEGLVSS